MTPFTPPSAPEVMITISGDDPEPGIQALRDFFAQKAIKEKPSTLKIVRSALAVGLFWIVGCSVVGFGIAMGILVYRLILG